MSAILYVETATCGRWLYKSGNTTDAQPHLSRLAFILVRDGQEELSWCRLIKPRTSWIYEPDAVASNGISRPSAEAEGATIENAMEHLFDAAQEADEMVAYNMDFHARVIERSCKDVHLARPAIWPTQRCAMRASVDVLRLPRIEPGGGYRWPKHNQAHEYFSNEPWPTVFGDPVQRGFSLVRGVRAIWEGTVAAKQQGSADR